MELWKFILLILTGFSAGFFNVIAGGGSLLTLPILVLIGLDGSVANGTNRIAIIAQNITAIITFKYYGLSNFKLSLSLSLCAIPGVIFGALLAINFDGIWFNKLLSIIIISVVIFTLQKDIKINFPKKKNDRYFFLIFL